MRLILLGMAALLLTGCAGAMPGAGEQVFGPRAGDSLMTVGASYSVVEVDDSRDTETVDAEVSLGASHFFADAHEFGILANLRRSEIEVGTVDLNSTIYSLTPFYNFNVLSGERTFFYVGPHAGIQLYDIEGDDHTSVSYGGHVGIRHFHSARTALFIEPRYTRYDVSGDNVNDFSILMGLQFRF